MSNLSKRLRLAQLNLDQFKTEIDNSIAAEASARVAGDDALQSGLDAEAAARSSADTTLQGNIDAEVARATAAEGTLDSKINTEIADRVAGDLAEKTRAEGEEARIEGKFDGEVSRIDGDVSAEVAARIAGDVNLQNQVDAIMSNADPAALDSFTEVVSAFQTADGDLNQAISDLSAAAAADRVAIRSEFAAADAALQGEIDAEETLRASEITRVEGLISAEETARLAEVDAEEDKRMAEDTLLLGHVNSLQMHSEEKVGTTEYTADGDKWGYGLPGGLVGAPSMYLNGQKLVAGPGGDCEFVGGEFKFPQSMIEPSDVVCFVYMTRGADPVFSK